MSPTLLGQAALAVAGLTAAGAIAGLVRALWRREPLTTYRLLVVILLVSLSLPVAQLLVQGRAAHWVPESMRSEAALSSAEAPRASGPGWSQGVTRPNDGAEARRRVGSTSREPERSFAPAHRPGLLEAGVPEALLEWVRRKDPSRSSETSKPARGWEASSDRSPSTERADEISNANGPVASSASAGSVVGSSEPERPSSPEEGARGAAAEPLATWPFALLYLLGMALVASGYLVRHLRTRCLVGSCRRVTDPEVLAIWRRVSRGSALRRRVELRTSARLSSPACCGWRRPVLLVPPGPVADSATLEWALRHELVHLERGDARVAGLQAVLTTIAWFHPVAWWLSRQLDRLRELSCDLLVVLKTGKRRSYALALLSYAGGPAPERSPVLGPNLLQWSRSPSQLRRRIEMLAQRDRSPSRRRRWGRAATIAVVFAVVWAAQLAIAATLIPRPKTAGETTAVDARPEVAGLSASAPEREDESPRPPEALPRPRPLARLGGFARAGDVVLSSSDQPPLGRLTFEELGEAWSDLGEPIQVADFSELAIEGGGLRPVEVLERLPWLVHVQTDEGVLKVSVQGGELVVTVDGRPVTRERIEMKPNRIIVRLEDGSVTDAPLPVVGLSAVTEVDGLFESLELDRTRLAKLQRDAWRQVHERLREAQRRAHRQRMSLDRLRASLERRWNERESSLRLEERRLQREWRQQERELERLKRELRRRQRRDEDRSEELVQQLEQELDALEESWERFDDQWSERVDDWREQLGEVREQREQWLESFEQLGNSFERDLEGSFEALDQDFEVLRDSFREQLEDGDGPWTPAFRQAWESAFQQLLPSFDQLCDEILADFESYGEALDEDVADYESWLESYQDERSQDLREIILSWNRTLAWHRPELRELLERAREVHARADLEVELEEVIGEIVDECQEVELDEEIEVDECEEIEEVEECDEERERPEPKREISRRLESRPTLDRAALQELRARLAQERAIARRIAAEPRPDSER